MDKAVTSASENPAETRGVFLEVKQVRKVYKPTIAVNDLDMTIYQGDILALVGANGAGKSTLTKILSGVISCDRGTLSIAGEPIDLGKYTPSVARQKGIRVVHQELSLCKNLTVYENFYIEQSQEFGRKPGWRKKARQMAQEALDEVFPGHNIDVAAGLDTLSIAQQQMVEIARATSDKSLKMLILDEPTSALPAEQTSQLQEYIKTSSQKGITYIYISHRLKEVMYLCNRIYIMQNGIEKWQCPISETSEEDMIRRMGEGIGLEEAALAAFEKPALNKQVCVTCSNYHAGPLHQISFQIHGGEIVGLTGLEGNGQQELLQQIFFLARKRRPGIAISGKVAYVAGDRKKEGIFPLWSIADNTSISKIADGNMMKLLSKSWVDGFVNHWYQKLHVKSDGTQALITSLSGGNQQKVLIARALAVDADIILLDDPTRGVDVATKVQLYGVFREAAANGKLVIWRTSDDAELEICTKLFVMGGGTVAGEFDSTGVDHEALLKVAFCNTAEKAQSLEKAKLKKQPLFLFAMLAMLLLYLICGLLSPAMFSKFGIELLAVGFTPFVFAALSQTFIIGLGHIDLGVGAFMGLVNVLCATVLDRSTGLGLLALAVALLAYAAMGVVIYLRNVPAIIVTLGMSFVWTGIALSLQSMPGGHTPDWMIRLFNFDNPVLQGVVLVLLVFILLSVFIYRSRYGTVLRGFGNNESAMLNSGWSTAKAYFFIYLIAGIFAMMGGIAFSAITGASDVNASSTFTMLTVAAVIIGGGYFSGGIVTHAGAVFGAVSLTMVSMLLGLLNISTDYTATIQGLVLIVILSLRLMKRGGAKVNG